MLLSTVVHYIPAWLTPTGHLLWDATPEEHDVARGHLADEMPAAAYALQQYVAALEQRFEPGGVFETRALPNGKTFLEIVCGHPFARENLCRCFSPLLAVQLFADAVERYVVQGRMSGTLYWRTHPELRQHTSALARWDEDLQKQQTWEETYYTVRSRLLIL